MLSNSMHLIVNQLGTSNETPWYQVEQALNCRTGRMGGVEGPVGWSKDDCLLIEWGWGEGDFCHGMPKEGYYSHFQKFRILMFFSAIFRTSRSHFECPMSELTQSAPWKRLEDHYRSIASVHMRDMFDRDHERFGKFSVRWNDLLLDYSKNRITTETMKLLLDLARSARLEEWRDKMFNGEKINFTESRAVLHTALRNQSGKPVYVDGKDVMPDVGRVLAHMKSRHRAIPRRRSRQLPRHPQGSPCLLRLPPSSSRRSTTLSSNLPASSIANCRRRWAAAPKSSK